ncbi:uncharacterized protein G2W53_030437 [Senna tora]|uniref:Uncharacterized protein n=1 Tax=Senna tora TaxID=362788 RepID=A0A834WCX8_9FABA|nr:uncharacterized protein G2W53_030437 [Senna tora]
MATFGIILKNEREVGACKFEHDSWLFSALCVAKTRQPVDTYSLAIYYASVQGPERISSMVMTGASTATTTMKYVMMNASRYMRRE